MFDCLVKIVVDVYSEKKKLKACKKSWRKINSSFSQKANKKAVKYQDKIKKKCYVLFFLTSFYE